jgi:hypothetical protein
MDLRHGLAAAGLDAGGGAPDRDLTQRPDPDRVPEARLNGLSPEATSKLTGNTYTVYSGYSGFQPISDVLVAEEPDFMD